MSRSIALITGGGGAIGFATARRLAERGFGLVLTGRTASTLESAKVALLDAGASSIECVPGDAVVPVDVRRAVDLAAQIGVLSVAVSVVGGATRRRLVDFGAAEFETALQRNVIPAFNVIRECTPAMVSAGGGSIVCVSSVVATTPYPMMTPYGAANAAVEGLVRGAALELAAHRIRVNAIQPGLIRSDASARHRRDVSDQIARFGNDLPLVRAGEPSDVAGLAAYLASDDAGWVTGQIIAVDGGRSLVGAPAHLRSFQTVATSA